MKVPSESLLKKLSRLIASFVIGIIVGSAIFLYIYGQTWDDLYIENRKLTIQNNNLQERINTEQQLTDELNQRAKQKLKVEEIDFHIIDEDNRFDELTKTEVIEQLLNEVKVIKNEPLESIAELSDMVEKLVHKKTLDVNQQRLEVHLHRTVIYTTITFKISLHTIN